jgi:phosphoribosylformylglycinamidine synthase
MIHGTAVGVLRFPGTNCDRDVFAAIEQGIAQVDGDQSQLKWLWHADQFDVNQFSMLFLPGGFSYGDYLRSGALAARSPVMNSVREAAKKGVPVLGICNGFQILCEAGLLPGALVRNNSMRFIDSWVDISLANENPYFGSKLTVGVEAKMPIAHADGKYYIKDDDLNRLRDRGQIWWNYLDNPNGAIADIAGVMNEQKNVAALMPHPERAVAGWMGSTAGRAFFEPAPGKA